MTTAREAAVDWATRALVDVLRQPEALMRTRAENFVAVADKLGIPDEELIGWIYEKCAGKDWTVAEWRRYCEYLLRRKAAVEHAD